MARFPTLRVGPPQRRGALALYPVHTDAPLRSRSRYATAGGVFEEQPDPGTGAVLATNPGRRPLLVSEGTLLEGGWQHRVVVISMVVPPGETRALRTLSVEAERWEGDRSLRDGGRRALSGVRGAVRGLGGGAPEDAEVMRRQYDVWRRIHDAEDRFGGSPTESLLDAQRSAEARASALVAGTAPESTQRGVIVAIGGEPVVIEVFEHPRLLAVHWSAIVTAAAIDALDGEDVAPSTFRCLTFAQHAMASAVDLPDDVVDATALFVDDELVHLSGVATDHPLVHGPGRVTSRPVSAPAT